MSQLADVLRQAVRRHFCNVYEQPPTDLGEDTLQFHTLQFQHSPQLAAALALAEPYLVA